MSTAAIPKMVKPRASSGIPPEYMYGWREVPQLRPDGTKEYVRIPLTAADVLHPQIGDVILERSLHNRERNYIRGALTGRTSGQQVMVYSDLLICWGVPGVGNHSPDVSAFEGLQDAVDFNRESLSVAEEKVQARLAVEIVSPRDRDPEARKNDTVYKLREYHQVGVPIYIIIDQEREHGPRRILGYRHTPQGYETITPDAEGRILLEFFNVWISVRENLVVCHDAITGEEILDTPELQAALRELKNATRDAEQRQQAELEARLAAEQQAQAEADARRAAEQRELAEADARRAAEQQAQAEAEARRVAEQRAQAEAQARVALEMRLQELEARLQSQGGNAGTPPTS